MKVSTSIGVAAVAAAVFVSSAERALAAPVTVLNAGFEAPTTPADSFLVGFAPNGWSAYGPLDMSSRVVGVLNPATTDLYLDPVPEGANVAVVFLQDVAVAEAGLEQTLAATLQPSTRYTLAVEVGNLASYDAPPHDAFDFDGFPGYRVELLAGGVVVAADEDSLDPGEGRFLTSTVTLDVGPVHAQLGQPLGVRLVNLDAAPGIEVNFDDVRLDATPIECPAPPVSGCRDAVPARGELSLGADPANIAANAASWGWTGAATAKEDFGDPLATTSLLFCVHDGADEAVLALRAEAGGTCGTKPCWKETGSGFRYRDRTGPLTSLQLKAGSEGKASVRMKARGADLAIPTLPLAQAPLPVRAILWNEESGECWEASYSTAPSGSPSTTRWKVRND